MSDTEWEPVTDTDLTDAEAEALGGLRRSAVETGAGQVTMAMEDDAGLFRGSLTTTLVGFFWLGSVVRISEDNDVTVIIAVGPEDEA